MKPTRSCLASPALRRADASRRARSSSCRYVYRRSPWITATLSGNTDALRSRKLTGVSSVRYTLLVGFIAALPSGERECPILLRPRALGERRDDDELDVVHAHRSPVGVFLKYS
jgi:hypothetical protein